MTYYLAISVSGQSGCWNKRSEKQDNITEILEKNCNIVKYTFIITNDYILIGDQGDNESDYCKKVASQNFVDYISK